MSLPIETCPICGEGPLQEIVRDRHLTLNGTPVVVHDDVVTECENCHDLFYTGKQAKAADRKANDARRRAENLLTGAEIIAVRRSLFLSQAQLELALGVGPKTIVRWEQSDAIQSKAVDDVLRLISLDADNLRLLVRIRDAALVSTVNQRLRDRDLKKKAELKEAILAALEHFDVTDDEMTRMGAAVVKAIREFKKEKMDRIALKQVASL